MKRLVAATAGFAAVAGIACVGRRRRAGVGISLADVAGTTIDLPRHSPAARDVRVAAGMVHRAFAVEESAFATTVTQAAVVGSPVEVTP
ncbi:MAG: hypothetical protein ACLQUT_08730 [Thermoleophilia bacterium]